MKKAIALSIVLLLTISCLIGCGRNKKTADNTNNPNEIVFSGKTFDNSFMTLTYPEDWICNDVPQVKQVFMQKGTISDLYILIKAEIDDTNRNSADMVNDFALTVNGSQAEMVTFGNTEYAKTTFFYGGIDQTMLVVKIDNNKVTLTIQGKGLMEDEGTINILKSIKYKF